MHPWSHFLALWRLGLGVSTAGSGSVSTGSFGAPLLALLALVLAAGFPFEDFGGFVLLGCPFGLLPFLPFGTLPFFGGVRFGGFGPSGWVLASLIMNLKQGPQGEWMLNNKKSKSHSDLTQIH